MRAKFKKLFAQKIGMSSKEVLVEGYTTMTDERIIEKYKSQFKGYENFKVQVDPKEPVLSEEDTKSLTEKHDPHSAVHRFM